MHSSISERGLKGHGAEHLPFKQRVEEKRNSLMRAAAFPLLFAGALCLSACSGAPQYENFSASVADVQSMPQELAFFAAEYGRAEDERLGADTLLRSHADASEDMAFFRRHFFQPWDITAADPLAVQDAIAELEREPARRCYGANMHPWSAEAWQELCEKADISGLRAALEPGHRPRPAVTVRGTDLRGVPSSAPRFSEVHGAGKGWPFDLFQQSALPVGLPLAVYHESADGAWLFVETSGIWGWVRAEDAAFAGAEFCRLWRGAKLSAFVRDGVGLRFKALGAGLPAKPSKNVPHVRPGVFLAEADIGTVLPSARSGEVLLPLRGLDGMAYAVTASYAGLAAPGGPADPSFGPAVLMPQSLTPRAVARIGDRMMGQPYGWGGLYGGRDCSAMMRDLFAPFGIWLPRNSGKQAEAGARADLSGLSAEAKEKALREGGLPFRTLVWLPGHIGLYVGQSEGRAALFHNMWGVRAELDDGREGRAILGRAVVTSLRPGVERDDADPDKTLVERVEAFTVIGGGAGSEEQGRSRVGSLSR